MLFSGDKTNTINALFAHLVGTKKNERMLYQYICSHTLSKKNKKHAVLYLLTLWGQERQTNMLYKKKRQICTINSHTEQQQRQKEKEKMLCLLTQWGQKKRKKMLHLLTQWNTNFEIMFLTHKVGTIITKKKYLLTLCGQEDRK